MFIYVNLAKNSIRLSCYTNQQKIAHFENVPNHENWGRATIHNTKELNNILPSLKESFKLMKLAEKEGINTGWYAVTPESKMPWKNSVESESENLE